jgi:hypothetical protein
MNWKYLTGHFADIANHSDYPLSLCAAAFQMLFCRFFAEKPV